MQDMLFLGLTLNLTMMLLIAFIGFIYTGRQMKRMHAEMRELHFMLNSRLSELLSVTAKTAHSEGVAEERERGQRS